MSCRANANTKMIKSGVGKQFVEQTANVPVSRHRNRSTRCKVISLEHVSEENVEQIEATSVPQITEETLEATRLVPQERISEHDVEEIIGIAEAQAEEVQGHREAQPRRQDTESYLGCALVMDPRRSRRDHPAYSTRAYFQAPRRADLDVCVPQIR